MNQYQDNQSNKEKRTVKLINCGHCGGVGCSVCMYTGKTKVTIIKQAEIELDEWLEIELRELLR